MRDDGILDRLADAGSAEEASRMFFYHGTGETFDGPPRGGAYDGLFWCADSPAIAQCYIPAAGSECLLSVSGFQLREKVRPSRHSDWYGLVRQMGRESPDVEWGPDGQAISWAVPEGYPTYGEVCDWLERELGYANASSSPQRERRYRVKARIRDGRPVYLPESHRDPGRLFVVDGLRELRFLDLATGREGDLTDPDHHKLLAFRRAEAAGFDGVIIHDWCQSRTHGNVGHLSWGVLPSALERLSWAIIPCVRFDWAEDESCSRRVTPEFEAEWERRRTIAPGPR